MTIPAPSGASHPCLRCGRPVEDPSAALCDECNPLGLAQPSATQVHGIALAGIGGFVVVLAVLAKLAIGGVGPFEGQVLTVAPAPVGLEVTIRLSNAGSKAGATTCRLDLVGASAGSTREVVQTPPVPAGGTIEFATTVTRFGSLPVGLVASCQSP